MQCNPLAVDSAMNSELLSLDMTACDAVHVPTPGWHTLPIGRRVLLRNCIIAAAAAASASAPPRTHAETLSMPSPPRTQQEYDRFAGVQCLEPFASPWTPSNAREFKRHLMLLAIPPHAATAATLQTSAHALQRQQPDLLLLGVVQRAMMSWTMA